MALPNKPHLRPVRIPRDEEWSDIDAAIQDALVRSAKRDHYSQTLLPDNAVVSVAFRDVEVGIVGGKSRWLLMFEITNTLPVDQSFIGRPLLRAYNAPQHEWLSPNHHLLLDWKAVTGLKPRAIPLKRSPRTVLGMFLRNCEVEATTHVVNRRMNPKTKRWESTPADTHYSVISKLGRPVLGCPRVLQRKSP